MFNNNKVLKDMKSFKKYITNGATVIAAVCGLLVSSCSTKEAIYTPTSTDVSFPDATESYTLDPKATTLTVYLNRGVADKALQVPITMVDKNNVFTLSTSSVSFEAGEYQKTITVTYDYKNFNPGTKYVFSLSFNTSVAGPGSYSTVTCSAQLPLEYESYMVTEFIESDRYVKGTGWVPADTCPFYAELGVNGTLMKAKYTDEYYKLINWGNISVEFTYTDAAGMTIFKDTDYNSALVVDGNYMDMKTTYNGNTYLFQFGPNPADQWYVMHTRSYTTTHPGLGDYIEFEYYVAKNGSWANAGYPVDEFILILKNH